MNPFRSKPKPDQPDPKGEPSPASEDGHGVDETAALIEQLDQQVARLTSERDEALDAHKRALADYQNYQRRALQNEQWAREQALRGVLSSVMTVLDHFDMALSQDPAKTTTGSIIQGVSMIKNELLMAVQAHGVGLIRPSRNEVFDPQRHEAIMQQSPAGGSPVEPGHIVSTLRIGYTVNDRIVRPAQVSVAPAAPESGAHGADGADQSFSSPGL